MCLGYPTLPTVGNVTADFFVPSFFFLLVGERGEPARTSFSCFSLSIAVENAKEGRKWAFLSLLLLLFFFVVTFAVSYGFCIRWFFLFLFLFRYEV